MICIMYCQGQFDLYYELLYIVYFQVHNVGFAFELMQDAGLPKPKSRAEGKNG